MFQVTQHECFISNRRCSWQEVLQEGDLYRACGEASVYLGATSPQCHTQQALCVTSKEGRWET